MRLILVTGSLSRGGAERHSVAVMNGLAGRGHQCHAAYIKPAGDLLDRVRLSNGGTVQCLNAARYLDPGAVVRFAARISEIRPSAIVASNAYALMYSWLALRYSRLRVRLVVVFHSNRLLGAKEELQMLLYRLFFRTADCSVFVSEKQRRYWLGRGVFSRRSEVIHNGVDTEEFRDRSTPEERAALRRGMGFSDSDYVVGLPALLRPEKNHVQLVDAIAMLRRWDIPARALLIGDGEMRDVVLSRARAHGIASSVVITGVQRDVRPLVAACDAVALCSFTEAFSMAALEAMALSRPVVHSDVGGAAEMIAPGRNGFLFPVGDTRAFVEKLAILADREVSRRMGREARATVEALFSEKMMTARYEQMLLELCGSAPAVLPEHADRVKATH